MSLTQVEIQSYLIGPKADMLGPHYNQVSQNTLSLAEAVNFESAEFVDATVALQHKLELRDTGHYYGIDGVRPDSIDWCFIEDAKIDNQVIGVIAEYLGGTATQWANVAVAREGVVDTNKRAFQQRIYPIGKHVLHAVEFKKADGGLWGVSLALRFAGEQQGALSTRSKQRERPHQHILLSPSYVLVD